jgi:hypothetical protein
LALALGVPWGAAAWGGSDAVLPTELRIASAASVLVFIAAAAIVLGRAGYWGQRLPRRLMHWGTWGLVVVFSLSALANAASSSPWERWLLAPIALLLAVMCLLVARSHA